MLGVNSVRHHVKAQLRLLTSDISAMGQPLDVCVYTLTVTQSIRRTRISHHGYLSPCESSVSLFSSADELSDSGDEIARSVKWDGLDLEGVQMALREHFDMEHYD